MAKITKPLEEYTPDVRLLDERGPTRERLDKSIERKPHWNWRLADQTDPRVIAIAEREAERDARAAEDRRLGRQIRENIASFERHDGNGDLIGANGLAAGKFREPTISRLINSGKIQAEELRAIEEIELVYSYLCAGLLLRGYQIKERLDKSHNSEPIGFIEAYRIYKKWAEEWSERKKRFGDKTLLVVYEVLFSMKTGKDLDEEHNWRHGTAINVFVNGLRDYAAMAGWVDRGTGLAWQKVARSVFPMRGM